MCISNFSDVTSTKIHARLLPTGYSIVYDEDLNQQVVLDICLSGHTRIGYSQKGLVTKQHFKEVSTETLTRQISNVLGTILGDTK